MCYVSTCKYLLMQRAVLFSRESGALQRWACHEENGPPLKWTPRSKYFKKYVVVFGPPVKYWARARDRDRLRLGLGVGLGRATTLFLDKGVRILRGSEYNVTGLWSTLPLRY